MSPFASHIEYALAGAVLLVPLSAMAAVGLARRAMARGHPVRRAWSRSRVEVGMVAGTLPWLVMGLWPVDLPPGAARWHLRPFADIAILVAGPPGEALVQIVGNLLVFFVLGMLAPVRFAFVAGPVRLFGLGAAASLTLETCQHLFATGRVFSVDDILLNALGCLLGGLATRRWWTALPAAAAEQPARARRR